MHKEYDHLWNIVLYTCFAIIDIYKQKNLPAEKYVILMNNR